MNPGELRERVVIQAPSETVNSLGETVLSWGTYAERWASVEGASAREALAAGQMDVTISHKVKMRYLDGLTQKMRIMWRGRILEIVSLLEHANRSVHELVCQETF
jgi:SPP1 family predicted phage head-tail adaptor